MNPIPLRRRVRPDRALLIEGLERVEYVEDAEDRRLFEQADFGRVLPLLLRLDQEALYGLCRDTARHLLGRDPDQADLPF
ncbi:hypothetical protein [Nonomuraea sp. NPDC050310]|uniref:hypothetical protein n=1 Tax=unclassified Nonomuraea TaxID=2593643 RepID=UPI00340367CA